MNWTSHVASPPRSRLPLIVAVSIGIHVGVAVILANVPASRKLVAQIIPVEVVDKPKPPPPKPRRPPPRPTRPRSAAKTRLPRIVPAPDQEPGAASGFGLEPDDGGAGTMEVPIGHTLEAPATPSAGPPPPLVLDLTDRSEGAAVARAPEPVGALRIAYPEPARLAGATGSATVEAFVAADGLVGRARLMAASGAAFGRSALEAVRQTRFKPAVRSGVAVAMTVRIPVRFELAGVAAAVAQEVTPVLVEEPASPSLAATASASATASATATVTATATGSAVLK